MALCSHTCKYCKKFFVSLTYHSRPDICYECQPSAAVECICLTCDSRTVWETGSSQPPKCIPCFEYERFMVDPTDYFPYSDDSGPRPDYLRIFAETFRRRDVKLGRLEGFHPRQKPNEPKTPLKPNQPKMPLKSVVNKRKIRGPVRKSPHTMETPLLNALLAGDTTGPSCYQRAGPAIDKLLFGEKK
jgi:hypothetical protein